MNEDIVGKVVGWIRKADGDLEMARLALANDIYDYSLFHSQQAVEKYLKAFLTYHNRPFGKTHNIALLIELCKEFDASFDVLFEVGADKLYPRGIEVRYPVPYTVSREDAVEALGIAERVRGFVLGRLGMLMSEG